MGSKKSNDRSHDLPVIDETETNTVTELDVKPAEVKTPVPTAEEKTAVYAYLGPNIRGVVTNGSIFTGKKDDIVNAIKARADVAGQGEKMSVIARLIVEDVNISKAKAKLKAGGNALSEAYKAILAED